MVQSMCSMDPEQAKLLLASAAYAAVIALQYTYVVKFIIPYRSGLNRKDLLELFWADPKDILHPTSRIAVLLAFLVGTGANSFVRTFSLKILRIFYSVSDANPVCDFSVGVIGTAAGALVGTATYTFLGGQKLWLSLLCGSIGSSILTVIFFGKSYLYTFIFIAIHVIAGSKVTGYFPIRDLTVSDVNTQEPERPKLPLSEKLRYPLEGTIVLVLVILVISSASVTRDFIKPNGHVLVKTILYGLADFAIVSSMWLYVIITLSNPIMLKCLSNLSHWPLTCAFTTPVMMFNFKLSLRNLIVEFTGAGKQSKLLPGPAFCAFVSFSFLSSVIAIGYLKLVSHMARSRLEESFDLKKITV